MLKIKRYSNVFEVFVEDPRLENIKFLGKELTEKLCKAGEFSIVKETAQEPKNREWICEMGVRTLSSKGKIERREIDGFYIVSPENIFREIAFVSQLSAISSEPEEYFEAMKKLRNFGSRFRLFANAARELLTSQVEFRELKGIRVCSEFEGRKLDEEVAIKIYEKVIMRNSRKANQQYTEFSIGEELIKNTSKLRERNRLLLEMDSGLITDEEGTLERIVKVARYADREFVITINPKNRILTEGYCVNPTSADIISITNEDLVEVIGYDIGFEPRAAVYDALNRIRRGQINPFEEMLIRRSKAQNDTKELDEEEEVCLSPLIYPHAVAQKIEELEGHTRRELGITLTELLDAVKKIIELEEKISV